MRSRVCSSYAVGSVGRRSSTSSNSSSSMPRVCQQQGGSVLQQPGDQRVDHIVAGLATGRYDGLGLVEELAQHVGRNVHGVATAAAVELEHHATVLVRTDADRTVAGRFLDAVPEKVAEDGPFAPRQ